jgi:hypothetical protein
VDEDACRMPGCVQRADEWSIYCVDHQIRGPQVGVGLPGDEVGDDFVDPAEVGYQAYEDQWRGCPHSSEMISLAVDVMHRWDPDSVVAWPLRLELCHMLHTWMLRTRELQPMRVVGDRQPEPDPVAFRSQFALAAIWIDDRTFFGAGDLARDLVHLLVVPAIALLGGAPAAVTLSSVGVSLVAAWRGLTRRRVQLTRPGHIRVFNAVHAASWTLTERPDGRRMAIQASVGTAQLEADLSPMSADEVMDTLADLQDKGVIQQIGDVWRVAF